MRVLCTFPGKNGDLLWALPTIRALSRRIGEPVHLQIPGRFAGIADLVQAQPYIQTIYVATDWTMEDTAPISPRVPPATIDIQQDMTFHLGYRDWPLPDLPRHTLQTLNYENQDLLPFSESELCLQEPWITVPPHDNFSKFYWPWCYGFTDEYFELKYGLVELLTKKPHRWPGRLPPISVGANDRWREEGGNAPMSWLESAALIKQSIAFLGCCSALHVLAVAIGTPAIIMEPQEARWNSIFWPLGMDGPQVRVVRGGDGKPTWDARHVRDTLREVVTAESMSARGCGCDPGANYTCRRHRPAHGWAE